MLSAHRRHLKTCEHTAKGWNYTLCQCPIWCDGTLNGQRFRRSLDTTNWERALRRLGRLERGEDQDFTEAPRGRTLDNAVTVYLDDAEKRNLKPGSLRSYRRCLKALAAKLPKLAISNLTTEHLMAFRDRQTMAPRTQRKEIEYLRAFCAFCVVHGWLTSNVAKLIKPPRVDDVATIPYTRAEVIKLLEACERMRGMWKSDTPEVRARAKALVLTLLYSGLRVGDVAQLKRSALEKTGHLVLRIMKTGVPMKVLLKPEAAAALKVLPAPGGNPTYFFWTGNGDIEDCSKSLWRTVSRVGKVAGVHAHPHRFRDTFAVELLTNGAEIRTVQQLLGHESIKTTEKHYAHFVAAHQKILDSAVTTLDFSPAPARPLLVSKLKNRRRNSK